MASKTLHAHDFAPGTSVGAYLRAQLVNGGSLPIPSGAAIDSSVVGADGSLTFDGLTEGQRYVAYAGGRQWSFFVEPGSLDAMRPINGQEAQRVRSDLDSLLNRGVVRVYEEPSVILLSGMDQTAAVQALMDNDEGRSYFDFGDDRHSYNFASLEPRSGQCYFSRGATLDHVPGSTDAIFYWPQSPREMLEGCTWIGLKFQGEVNDAAFEAQRCGIFVIYGHRMLVLDCEFYDFRSSAVHMSDCGDVTYMNLLVERCSNGEELQFNAGNIGRNALEIIGSALAGNETANYAWLAFNCKVHMNGASKGGAGGIVTNMREATYVRSTIKSCQVHDALNFCGIGAEGWSRYTSITDNKTFGCLTGIFVLDTSGGTFGAAQINDRMGIIGNNVDCKCVTPGGSHRPATSLLPELTVAYEADVPGAIGIWAHPSHTPIVANTIRSTGDAIRSLGSASRRIVGTNIASNTITIANLDAANRPWGIVLQAADDCGVANNLVTLEVGATMKDAYYFSDFSGLSEGPNFSRRAGRSAIRIAGSGTHSKFTGGLHLDPATNEAAAGVDVTATGCSDLHFGGGVTVKDTRGGSATMTFGMSFSGAIPNSDTGEMVLLGWVSGAINGNTNVAVNQRALYCQETVPKSWGQAGHRFSRATAAAWAARAGSWTRGDRCEYNDPSAAGFLGEVITTSGTPGTSKTYAPITA